MSHAKKIDLGMTGYDELFMSEEERAENRLPKIYEIPLSEIDDFPDHPYRVLDDEDMRSALQRRLRKILTARTALSVPTARRISSASATGLTQEISTSTEFRSALPTWITRTFARNSARSAIWRMRSLRR